MLENKKIREKGELDEKKDDSYVYDDCMFVFYLLGKG